MSKPAAVFDPLRALVQKVDTSAMAATTMARRLTEVQMDGVEVAANTKPKGRSAAMAQKSQAALEAEVKELRDYVDELETKLDTIAEVVGEEEAPDEDDEDDEDEGDEGDEEEDEREDCNDEHIPKR